MKITQSLIFVALTIAATGCASAPRVLTVKSNPAEAEVCIKGRPGNEHFKQTKYCIGSTPLEVDSVTIAEEGGRKRVVHFNELDQEKEQFYVVVSRQGYAPQSIMVPSWDHFVTLREELAVKEVPAAQPVAPAISKGGAKISSDPVGALVYVNDFLKGNTPYLLEGENGQTLRIKIEQAGYRPIERSITIDNGRTMEINLAMEKAEKPSLLTQETRELASEQAAK